MVQLGNHGLKLIGLLLRLGRQMRLLDILRVVVPSVEHLQLLFFLDIVLVLDLLPLLSDLLVHLGPHLF